MKFIFKKKLILVSLQRIIGLSKKKSNLPILNYILMKIIDGYLFLISSNLEIEIISKVVLEFFDVNGSLTINARKFFDICKNFPDRSLITISFDQKIIIIKSKYIKFFLHTLPVSDFPSFSKLQSSISFTLRSNLLKQLIDSVKYFIAVNDLRYYLNGMFFEAFLNTIKVVSTDGYRLSVSSFFSKDGIPNFSLIIPRNSVLELSKILNSSEEQVIIKISNTAIRFIIEDCICTSKLISGNFPDYLNILPKKINKIFQVDRFFLIRALNRVSIVSNDKTRFVKFFLQKNKLIITSNNQINEKAKEIVDVFYNFDAIEIAFNIYYLLDIVKLIKDCKINFFLIDSLSAVKIAGYQDKQSVYILMPIRL